MPDALAIFDCSLARCATGRFCSNLRELLDAVRSVSDSVIEHHMMRCALEDYFELYEFPNDFARWCWTALGDQVLGEQLGLIDPYQHQTITTVRAVLADTIEDRLWGVDRVPWCRPGLDLHLVESRLVTYDTEDRVHSPQELLAALERMSLRSLYYHVHEAHRRTQGGGDDFSLWLEAIHADPLLIADLRAIDFYFLNLRQLRQEFVRVFRQRLEAPAAASKEGP